MGDRDRICLFWVSCIRLEKTKKIEKKKFGEPKKLNKTSLYHCGLPCCSLKKFQHVVIRIDCVSPSQLAVEETIQSDSE